MSDIQCIFCNSDNVKIEQWWIRNNFKLTTCQKCNGKFITPRPTHSELVSYYNSLSSIRFFKQTDAEAIKDSRKLKKQIEEIHPTANDVLEVGCSTGYYLRGLKLSGYKVMGSELSVEACELAEKWYDVKVYSGEFPPISYFEQFDVVIIHHVIEHVSNPNAFFSEALQYLRKGGIILIETPNYDSLGIKLFKGHYPVLCPPGHLNFFRKSTVSDLQKSKAVDLIFFETNSNANYTIYNLFVALSSFLKVKNRLNQVVSKRRVETDNTGQSYITNTKFSLTKKLLVFSRIGHFILYPVFYILDKIGLGENLSFVFRKQ